MLYVVVASGDKTGFAIVVLLTPCVGSHWKLVALLVMMGVIEESEQTVRLGGMVNVISGLTVTVNVLTIGGQEPRVPVTVYIVLGAVGDSTGFALVGSLTPVVGDHEYVVALLLVLALKDAL